MDAVKDTTKSPDLAALEAKVDKLTEHVELLVRRERQTAELFEESGPILKEVTNVAIERLSRLEARGYFTFGSELAKMVDTVVASYSQDDLQRLTESIVGILDTVKNVTQPDVLSVVNDAGEVIHNAGSYPPIGVLGVMKATRDDDVQRGLAVGLEMLKHIGKAAKVYSRNTATPSQKASARLGSRLAPRRAPQPVAPALATPALAAAVAPPPAPTIDGIALDAEGFLVDPSQWSRELAATIALTLGLDALTESHWTVIDYARADFLVTAVSPNIRRITKGSGVPTKALYTLFPKAPGKAVAKIAGIPKPAGCI